MSVWRVESVSVYPVFIKVDITSVLRRQLVSPARDWPSGRAMEAIGEVAGVKVEIFGEKLSILETLRPIRR
jgi:hypothetical protein